MNEINEHNRRPLSTKDLRDLIQVSNASVSADGKFLLYVKTIISWDQNTTTDLISVVELATGSIVTEWEGSAPQWSPVTNEIAYLQDHEGITFIWICSLRDHEKRPLTPVYESHYFMGHLSTKGFLWSPKGDSIAYISTHKPVTDSAPDGPKVIDRLLYKTRGGGGRPAVTDDLLSHIWLVSAGGGVASLITDTVYNEHSICWSPDGMKIAFVSNHTADADNNQLHDLWSVDINTKETRRYTENFGTVYQPAWSPDGDSIAFLGTKSKIATNDSPAEDTQLYIVNGAGNNTYCLTQSFDRRIEQISWHPDGEFIYFTAGNEGTTAIFRITENGELDEHVLGEECQVHEYAFAGGTDKLIFIASETQRPGEVFLFEPGTGEITQITHTSAPFTERFILQPAKPFWFTSFDEKDIQGWIIQPADFDELLRYPLVLVIHGGPHNMFGFGFEDRMQLLAACGYGVLFINPRGSSGYGQAFSNGCVQNWGGGDYKDLMAGVDAAVRQNTWVDENRLLVTGQSYGGYMTNWIITQTPRFRAAVCDGGISNLVSFAGTSLYHSLMESEFNGSAYDNFPLLWQWSPLRNIKNVSTPTLFLHGGSDNEVPFSQAEEMYIGLKKNGVKTRLVKYPGEGHGWRPDLKPRSREDVFQRMLAWFKEHLAPSDQNGTEQTK